MVNTETAEFRFRVWVYPKEADAAEVEVWYDQLENTDPGRRLISDWAKEVLGEQDFHELFGLDHNKTWQVVATAKITGHCDDLGEYEDDFEVLSFDKAEVLPGWFGDDLAELISASGPAYQLGCPGCKSSFNEPQAEDGTSPAPDEVILCPNCWEKYPRSRYAEVPTCVK